MHGTDDRGRSVRVVSAFELAGPFSLWSPLTKDCGRRVAGRLHRVRWSRNAILPVIVWFVLFLIALTLFGDAFSRLTTRGRSIWLGALWGLVVPLSMIPAGYFTSWRMRGHVARLIVEDGLCATCGYALEGVAPAADGCTVCPECGSAWDRSILPAAFPEPTPALASIFCRDDRGQRVSVLRQWRAGITPGITGPPPRLRGAGAAPRIDREVTNRMLRSLALVLAALLGWFWAWTEQVVPRLVALDLHPLLKSALWLLIPAAPLPLFVLLLLAVSRERTARIAAATGFCGCCGKDLKAVVPAADGCTACPECGSAWRVGAPKDA